MEVKPGCAPSSSLSGRGNLPWKAASSGFKSPLEGSPNSLALSFPIVVPAFWFHSLSDWFCHWGHNTLHSVLLDGAARAGYLWQSQLQRPSTGDNCLQLGGKENPSVQVTSRMQAGPCWRLWLSSHQLHFPQSLVLILQVLQLITPSPCAHTHNKTKRCGFFPISDWSWSLGKWVLKIFWLIFFHYYGSVVW